MTSSSSSSSSSSSISNLRRLIFVILVVSAATAGAASARTASAMSVSKAASPTIVSVNAKINYRLSRGFIHLTATAMLPASHISLFRFAPSSRVFFTITFQEMGELNRGPVLAVSRVYLQQQGRSVSSKITIPNIKLPGVYRLTLRVAVPHGELVIRGVDPVAGACSSAYGPGGTISSGCITVNE